MSSAQKTKRLASPKPLTFLLKQLQNALRTSVDLALEPIQLTMAEAAVLADLSVSPRRSNAELARSAFITPQSMIAMLTALEKRGLITRRPNPNGGRAMPAELTGQGSRQLLEFYLAMRDIEAKLQSGLSRDEQTQLRHLLERCLESLQSEARK
jgi:DNA-binding MarR family transcriptional regulator